MPPHAKRSVNMRGFQCGEFGGMEMRRRTRIKNRKIKKNHYDLRIEEQYGITVNELDIILFQLCREFKCQWTVIARELFRQHGISMANNAIRERYSSYLDPNLRKEWYSDQEAAELTKMFWIQGKNYQQINRVFGNHGRGAVRQCLCYAARRGLSRLMKHLNQDQNHPSIVLSSIERQYFVSAICSQGTVEWNKYRYSYLLFYFFVYNQGQAIQQIPQELARTLYQRLANRSHKRLKERAQYYNKVNPQENFQERLQQRKERYYSYLKTYRQANRERSSEADSSDCGLAIPNNEEMNIDIGNLSIGQCDLDLDELDISSIELKDNQNDP